MSTVQLLPGITQKKVKTDRLEVAYLEAGTGSIPLVLVHGNCSSSHFFQDFMLALAAKAIYTVYAPDMRGYGDSEVLSVDATGGMRDFSNDLNAFVQSLDLNPFHLLGWSLGGNIAMQYVIDHPGNVHSLTLESVVHHLALEARRILSELQPGQTLPAVAAELQIQSLYNASLREIEAMSSSHLAQ